MNIKLGKNRFVQITTLGTTLMFLFSLQSFTLSSSAEEQLKTKLMAMPDEEIKQRALSANQTETYRANEVVNRLDGKTQDAVYLIINQYLNDK